jgi:hypothetical protein
MGSSLVLATGPKRESPAVQQSRDGRRRCFNPQMSQALTEGAERAVRPLHAGSRVSGGDVGQQPFQGLQNSGDVTSAHLRPPPARRMRRAGTVSCWYNSRRPRAIVLRSIPVIRARRAIPPRPCCWARKPTRSRRLRSSARAASRLIAWCSRAVGPSASRRQHGHEQRWISWASFS